MESESKRERDIRKVMGKMEDAAKTDPALRAAINRGRLAARRFNARLRATGCTKAVEAVDKSEQRFARFLEETASCVGGRRVGCYRRTERTPR